MVIEKRSSSVSDALKTADPLYLHHLERAETFLASARWAADVDNSGRNGLVFQNIGYAVELALKAFLLWSGWSDDRCRLEVRHDLAIALAAAEQLGLFLGDQQARALIATLSPFYRRHAVHELSKSDAKKWSSVNALRAAEHILELVARSVGPPGESPHPGAC